MTITIKIIAPYYTVVILTILQSYQLVKNMFFLFKKLFYPLQSLRTNTLLSCWDLRRWALNACKLIRTDLVDCWLHCSVEEGWGSSLLPRWCEALRHWTYWREWWNRWSCWGKRGLAHSWKHWVTPAGTGACWGNVRQLEAHPLPHFGTQLEERWGNYGRTTWHGVGAAGMVVWG